MSDTNQVVQCSGKEEYMRHIKLSMAEFANKVVDTEEVYGAFCVIDHGVSAEVLQLGNERSLQDIQRHIAQLASEGKLAGAKVVPNHRLAKVLITLGIGVLIGMML